VVYAHLAADADHTGKLALQYWLYYTFNDAKNKHEGDWEMAQVDFNASTPDQALRTAPYQVDLAQHAGGERSAWTDHRVRRDGTHPVVFVATGSHASYFGAHLYLGRSPHEGFGCDSTRQATQPAPAQIVLLPDVPTSASAPFAWLAFHGRWGQRERAINNGPTGPAAKEQWLHPIEWADGLRAGSVTVPGTATLGPTLTNFFCGAVSTTSSALIWGLVHPAPFLVLLALVPFLCVAPARRTTWRPANPDPVRARRGGGQIIGAAARLYKRDLGTFLTLGLVFVPVAALASAVQWVLFHLTGLSSLVALDGKTGAVTILFTVMIGDLAAAFAGVLATGAIAAVLHEESDGQRLSAREAARRVRARLRPLAAATLIQYGVVLVLTLTIVGIPLAIHRFIRWSLFAQACMLDRRDGRGSLARSSRLVQGHWWRTFGFTVLVSMLSVVSGLAFGIALLLLTSQTLNFIDLASSLVYVLTVPFTAAALTLYYFDLEARGGAEPAPAAVAAASPPAASDTGW
jgi:ABC-type sugar transport system permease subunit